ncbi:Histone H1 [Hibiscus syriacus]|uniref:Histone H1 n=2 Tax=Hibiscus syriacus TaxID=106335 RepID=A0A6A2X6N6_HIBSY|nr:Histone H1 [Hibiscus syriacus]
MVAATASAVAPVAKKKTAAAKKPKSASSHPPFLDMISDAIVSLKERAGSSQYAIAKFIEEKHKQLPSNFRKNLLVQLKKFVASGKLVKVKASYKLPPASAVAKKPAAAKPKAATSATVKSKPKVAVKAPSKPKAKAATPVKAKAKVAAKPKAKAKTKAVTKPTKAAKTTKTSTPAKKVKSPAKRKAVVAKKPKSVKSPAKKAAKKAKKCILYPFCSIFLLTHHSIFATITFELICRIGSFPMVTEALAVTPAASFCRFFLR